MRVIEWHGIVKMSKLAKCPHCKKYIDITFNPETCPKCELGLDVSLEVEEYQQPESVVDWVAVCAGGIVFLLMSLTLTTSFGAVGGCVAPISGFFIYYVLREGWKKEK